MTISYRKISLLSVLALLTACAQNPEIPQLKSEVGQLNQKLQSLTNQASALEQQSSLNRMSDQGVYLLPAANSGARLKTSIGELSISLSHISPEANGTQALLHIRALSQAQLPAFTATVDWGEVDPATGKPLTIDMLSQPISVSTSLLPKTEETIELRFSGLTPEQLGFIRLHHVVPVSASTDSATASSPVMN
ncbi:DUF3251 domain-containing protein [Edaphovirga cremea]|uniref:DUF3251 domain-containing protein n=1 Tax=Edaphovirga cremea TaxID=2267246 RepID=UPI000DEEB0F7|nr:DUF3251 domain-containing protein [Edaphovirga cremea]